MKKRRKLSKIGKIIVGFLVILCIAAIAFFIYKINYNNLPSRIYINDEKYIVKIDYPKLKSKDITKEIHKYIDEKKDNFIDTVQNQDMINDEKYDFIGMYTSSERDDIVSIQVTLFAYTGGNHYIREDKSYHYNEETNSLVDLDYFLDNDSSLEELSTLAYYYVLDYAEDNDKKFDDAWVRDGTSKELDNFSHFNFTEEGMEIIFPPYQVASWADGEIKIIIPYKELKGILKPQFLKGVNVLDPSVSTPGKRDLSQFSDKKLIAFTFDDGPSTEVTNHLLDRLDDYNARVTFFVLGSRVNTYQETLKRAYEMGNQIGSHTYSHVNLLKLDDYELTREIKRTNAAIKEILGVEPHLLRPPYGNINDHIKKIANMNIIQWGIDTLDWKYKDSTRIKNEIVSNAHDGAIVLLHDLYMTSVEGALLAMDELSKEGYAFVTIDELAEIKDIELDTTTSYFSIKK